MSSVRVPQQARGEERRERILRATLSAIADQGIDVLSIPWLQLVLFVALAAVAGVLAAVLPARRAARLDVLAAIGAE